MQANNKTLFTAALFCIGILFWLLPSTLYLSNISEWNYDSRPLQIIAETGFVLLLGLSFVGWLTTNFSKLRTGLIVALISLGCLTYLNDAFAPVQLRVLDGSSQQSPEPFNITVIELALSLLSIIVVSYAWRQGSEWLRTLVQIGCLVSITAIVGTLAYSSYATHKAYNPDPPQGNAKDKPNVYQLHMDAMQTDYFVNYLNENNLHDRFPGFELFSNNITPYLFTVPSVKSYLSSSTYKSGSYIDWTKSSNEGLISSLTSSNYHLTLYTKANLFDSSKFHKVTTSSELLSKNLGGNSEGLHDFIQLWLARILPNVLTNEALRWGSAIAKTIQPKSNDTPAAPSSIQEGVEPYSGVLTMRQLIADEHKRTAVNEYILAMPLIPHGPNAINAECEYSAPVKGERFPPNYIEQLACSTKLILAFFDELKRLDRYDNSLIVIHGDHGSGWAGTAKPSFPSPPVDRSIISWNISALKARSMALLMIKTPNNTNKPLNINNVKSSNLDIYPTLASLLKLDIDQSQVEGKDLFDTTSLANERARHVYFFKPGPSHEKKMHKFSVKCANAKCSDFNLVKPAKTTKP